MSHRVYIAAPSECARRVRVIAKEIAARRPDVEIVSRWHDIPIVDKYPYKPEERRAAAAMNLAGIEHADTFVLLTDDGVPRSSWVELGIAIGLKKLIVWISGEKPEQRTIFDWLDRCFMVHAASPVPDVVAAIAITAMIPKEASEG